MALTTAQIIEVFECLEVTYGPGDSQNANVDAATIHNNFGITLTLSDMNALRDALKVYLGTLDSAVESKIVSLLAEWDAVRLQTVAIQDGSTGETSGVTMDPQKVRERIRTMMQVYVPVMDISQSIKRRKGPDGTARVAWGGR